jgi:hypothetical protein
MFDEIGGVVRMKKLLQMLLVVCVVFLNAQLVSANPERTITTEGFDLSTIHRLVIVDPQYSPVKDGATKDAVMNMLYKIGASARIYVMPKSDVEASILKDSSVDLSSLEPKKADELFKSNVGKYADAYMVATIVHNSRVVIFYDVYSAQTNQIVYSYEIAAGSNDDDSLKTYEGLTKDFYRSFEKTVQQQIKDQTKKK